MGSKLFCEAVSIVGIQCITFRCSKSDMRFTALFGKQLVVLFGHLETSIDSVFRVVAILLKKHGRQQATYKPD